MLLQTLLVCAGTGCLANGSLAVMESLERSIRSRKLTAKLKLGLKATGCHGFCEKGPLVVLQPRGTFYTKVRVSNVGRILDETVTKGEIIRAVVEMCLEAGAGKADRDPPSPLLDSPDAALVKVQTDDANVEIVKEGDTLRIAVDADDAVVRCNVPIRGVLEALEDWDWETFDPRMVLDMLHAAENGDLVTVATEDGVRVAIKMW